jgi:hypothetical protein
MLGRLPQRSGCPRGAASDWHGLAWHFPQHGLLRWMCHALELGGQRHGQPTVLLLHELRGRVELRVKALHRLRSVPTKAAPSGVLFHLVGVVVEFRS